jgi:hypothetical protein
LNHVLEGLLLDKIVVPPVDFTGTRLARGVRNRRMDARDGEHEFLA